jgi:hypothetical protein
MASSGNFATLTQSSVGYANLLEGNLNVTGTSNTDIGSFQSTMGVSSGKWYVEMNFVTKAYSHPSLGINGGTQVNTLDSNQGMLPNLIWYAGNTSNKLNELSMTNDVWGTYSENESSVSGRSNGDVVMIALDVDNKKLWYGANGTWFNSGDPAANDGNWAQSWTSNPNSIHFAFSCYNLAVQVVNFGQDSTFGGRITAGGNADGNGFGDFKYSPPSGFLALCSGNLPISDDIDPAQTDDDFPGKQFGVVTWTGNGTARSFTGLGFQPDMLWIKMRNSGDHGKITDSVRGVQKALISNTTGAETTDTNGVTAFGTDGFSIGSGNQYNLNEYNFVAWCWRGNGGTTASNSNGSITSTVQANTAAGFSIATYTSPGSGTNHTVGHGLSDVDFIITKDRDSTFNWYCFHKSVPDKTYRLNSGSEHSYSNWSMGSTTWGSEDGYTHNSTDKFVAYCWQNVEGMQKFGSYIGNGNSDGPFVYLGFRPRLLVLKRTTSSGYWNVFDSARSTSNPVNKYLSWNSTDAEADGADVDFLSNGFKVRSTASGVNTNGTTYLYMAWADVSFKYNNTF